jgi:tetratricopeptide (TPR) repeat protein
VWLLLLCLLFTASAVQSQNFDKATAVRQAYEAGDKALRQGDLAAARKSFLRVLEIVPEDLGARINLGVVLMRQKNWKGALEYLREAEKRAPQITGIRLNIGLAEYREANYRAAIPAFESVVRDQPDSTQARHLLGLSYLFEERYADAAATLEPLWPTSNNDLSYLYSLAVAAGNAGRHDLQERALARLMEIGSDSPLLHLLRGKAYLAHEDFDGALKQFKIAARADPKLPLLHYNLGVVYRRQGNLDKARQEFLDDIALEPGVAFNYDQLGAIFYQLQRDQIAARYFREALERDPKLGTSWFGLAKLYKREKRYTEALKAVDEAGSIDANSASVHYLRAQILAETGRHKEAETELAVVRRLKRETLDKLEQQVNGAKYHDPELAGSADR